MVLQTHFFWPLSVILSEAKDLFGTERLEMLRFEILRFAQDDNHELRFEIVFEAGGTHQQRVATTGKQRKALEIGGVDIPDRLLVKFRVRNVPPPATSFLKPRFSLGNGS